MGSLIYDFLTESFLFDPARLSDSFHGITDSELNTELQKYRDFCLERLDGITKEAVSSPTGLRVFAGLNEVGFQTLKQSALYIHQYVLPDPIFPFSAPRTNIAAAASSVLGYQSSGLEIAQDWQRPLSV